MFASRVHRLLAAGLLLLVPALTGCGGSGGPGDVVASFYPLQFGAQRVAGGLPWGSTTSSPTGSVNVPSGATSIRKVSAEAKPTRAFAVPAVKV